MAGKFSPGCSGTYQKKYISRYTNGRRYLSRKMKREWTKAIYLNHFEYVHSLSATVPAVNCQFFPLLSSRIQPLEQPRPLRTSILQENGQLPSTQRSCHDSSSPAATHSPRQTQGRRAITQGKELCTLSAHLYRPSLLYLRATTPHQSYSSLCSPRCIYAKPSSRQSTQDCHRNGSEF